MIFESKFNLGQHIWVVLENNGDLIVYDDYIVEITVDKNGITYATESDMLIIKENDVIKYEDSHRLHQVITEKMKEIREKEESEGEAKDGVETEL